MKKLQNPVKIKSVIAQYERQLVQIARHCGGIVKMLRWDDEIVTDAQRAAHALQSYAETLRYWGALASVKMLKQLDRKNEAAWTAFSQELSAGLRDTIQNTPTGKLMQDAVRRQVDLITSLPLQAAERVQTLAIRAVESGERSGAIVDDIMRTGDVTISRARTIARTEVGRASTELTKARAEATGSTQFIWRTMHDSDVRHEHAKIDGHVFEWKNPPTFADGQSYLPSCFPNCRCFAVPVFIDD